MKQHFSTYEEVLKFLYAQLPMFQKIGKIAFKKDLTNIRLLCEVLDNPQEKFKSIHIAGTNGKGSVSNILANILTKNAYKVGLYTSPHLVNFTERIQIDFQEISQEFVVDFVNRIQAKLAEIQPSFFELTVAMAFDYFAKSNVDFAVIETGLGGRLDSTNVLNPILSIITNISFDHQNMLGDTLQEICMEKAGIIKENTPILSAVYQESLQKCIEEIAIKRNSAFFQLNSDFQILDSDLSGTKFTFKGPKYETKLLGNFQVRNNVTAIQAIEILVENSDLKITEKQLHSAISTTRIKARMEILSENPLIIYDVAHNEESVRELMNFLKNHKNPEDLHFILGFSQDKLLDDFIPYFFNQSKYYCVDAKTPRGLPAVQLHKKLKKLGFVSKVFEDINHAINQAKTDLTTENSTIVIFGSFYLYEQIDIGEQSRYLESF